VIVPSPLSYHTSEPPIWLFTTMSISPKNSTYGPAGGRRGAIVACLEDGDSQLEQIRRGSISTAFNTMKIQNRPWKLPLPVLKPSATYVEPMLSPPSSPKSPPSPLHQRVQLTEMEEEQTDYHDRRYQRQVMTRLQALNSFNNQKDEVIVSKEHKFTPPPSPRPVPPELPARLPRSGSDGGYKRRTRSLKSPNCIPPVSSPLPSPCLYPRSTKGGRRVSAPSAITSSSTTSHTSSRGAVKKVSTSTCSSRRASSKGLEVLLEGTLFKSGWSWASAYKNGNTAAIEEAV